MFDKRFSPWYRRNQTAFTHWVTLRESIAMAAARSGKPRPLALWRFNALTEAVASIRLSPRAWERAQYAQVVDMVLQAGRQAGITVSAVAEAPPRRRLRSFFGMCAVNDFVSQTLGWEIVGWNVTRDRICDHATNRT